MRDGSQDFAYSFRPFDKLVSEFKCGGKDVSSNERPKFPRHQKLWKIKLCCSVMSSWVEDNWRSGSYKHLRKRTKVHIEWRGVCKIGWATAQCRCGCKFCERRCEVFEINHQISCDDISARWNLVHHYKVNNILKAIHFVEKVTVPIIWY